MITKRFTLIELIISVVIFAIVATATGTYLQNLLVNVSQPGKLITQSNEFRSMVHNMRGEFDENYKNDVSGFKTLFDSSAGKDSVFGGTYTILRSDFVELTESTNTYTESVVASSDILLVKIRNSQGSEEATIVFIGG